MTVTVEELRDVIAGVLKEHDVSGWSEDFDFIASGEVDSLDHASIALAVEERYGVSISDETIPELTSIQAFQREIARQKA